MRTCTRAIVAWGLAGSLCAVAPVSAQSRPVERVLAELGFTEAQIADVRSGKIVRRDVESAHERDIAVGFAFTVPVRPVTLVAELKAGMLAHVDPNTMSEGDVAAGTLEDFARLSLTPDGERRAKRYTSAAPGDDLNLSEQEIAAFRALGPSPTMADVEKEIRRALLARVQSYRAGGLDGISPYARAKGLRSAAGDLRAALESMRPVKKHAPAAYAAIETYPRAVPAGTEERMTWTQLNAHGVPTIVLTHGMFVRDGDAYIALQRQFYVSEGFNCEQAIAAFLPLEGATVVIYVNHTSTDQVAGFGGGAKRAIGVKVMAAELEKIFSRLQAAVR